MAATFPRPRFSIPSFTERFGTAFEIRQLGDYQVEVSIDSETVVDLAATCKEFIDSAETYVLGLSDSPTP